MQPKKGFTLVELLIVIVIVAVLATIAVAFLWRAKDRALLTSVQSDLRRLGTQQELYYADHQVYAASIADLGDFELSGGVQLSITAADGRGWAATATHASLSSIKCGIFFGEANAADAAPASIAGAVACN